MIKLNVTFQGTTLTQLHSTPSTILINQPTTCTDFHMHLTHTHTHTQSVSPTLSVGTSNGKASQNMLASDYD